MDIQVQWKQHDRCSRGQEQEQEWMWKCWYYVARRERKHFKIHRMCHQYLNFGKYWKFSREKQKYTSYELRSHKEKVLLEIHLTYLEKDFTCLKNC
jgi:hypothetical protein